MSTRARRGHKVNERERQNLEKQRRIRDTGQKHTKKETDFGREKREVRIQRFGYNT